MAMIAWGMDSLRIFCDVARLRSFSRAAELHDVTQSAVSQRLRSLEEELGVQLIDRSRRPLELTAEGLAYYRGCRRILARYDELTHQITGLAAAPEGGEVSIAAIYSSDMVRLNHVRSDFQAAHPQARVRINYLHPDDVYERVRQGECDFGIVSYPERLRDMESIRLREEVMVLVCAARHRLAGRTRVRASDLAGEALVGFDPHLPISRAIVSYLRGHGVQPEIVHSFDNVDTIKAAVASSDGVALLPERTVRTEVELGVLSSVSLKPTLIRPVGIIHRRGQEFSPLVRSFIAFLLSYERSASKAPIERAPASLTV
jgi:DNA-binding transcriptional LysR family regulator